LSDLSPLKDLTTLKYLDVSDCPIVNLPKEIVKQGAEAIRNYFKQIEEQGGTEELYEGKLIIVGEGGTGKTTLFEKLKSPTLPIGNTSETHGINIHEGLEIHHADLGTQVFHANLWDFGGQELQYMTHQFFLTPNALYVLMMDARRESPNLAYWFKIISLLGKDALRPENKVSLLLAQLLPDAPPTPQYQWHTQSGALQFRYQYPIMPKGLMSRLIVRLSEHFEIRDNTEIVWKKGAILNIKKDNYECRLMMKEEDEESPSGLRQIIIEVMGDTRYRKYALRKVRDEVDALHEKWFRNINVEEMVPCNCSECKAAKEPTLFKLSVLLNLQKKVSNAAKQCDNSYEMVPITQLLEGVYEADEIDSIRYNAYQTYKNH
jgi:GTPase SAR1 family protein